MVEINVLNEEVLTLIETKELLKKVEARDKNLSVRATKTKEYLNRFATIDTKEAAGLKKKLNEAGIIKLKPRHIAKIIDLMPKDIDSLKIVFVGENITFKQEELKKVIECLK